MPSKASVRYASQTREYSTQLEAVGYSPIIYVVILIVRRWRFSCNQSTDSNSSKNELDPTSQFLKLFAEEYIATCKILPSQISTCDNLISFTSKWQRGTYRSIPDEVKEDVLSVDCEDEPKNL